MNKEQAGGTAMSELTADQIVAELRKMENSAQVVLDSGFGTHEGEHDLIYRKRRDIAKGAADLIESLQRERDNPQPLTFDQIKNMVGKPVYDKRNSSWKVIESIYDPDEDYALDIESCARGVISFTDDTETGYEQDCSFLYAAEPKGENHD